MDINKDKVFKVRTKSWGQQNNSFLDRVIERIRLTKIINYLKPGIKMLDMGCGYNSRLLNSVSNVISEGYGIDIAVNKDQIKSNIFLIEERVDGDIKLKGNYFDLVTSMAVIEHVDNPTRMVKETYRLLKKDGILLLTTPDRKAKKILEFLAFNLGLIDKNEIKDHKRYYSKNALISVLRQSGFKKNNIEVNTFELGLNLFARAVK